MDTRLTLLRPLRMPALSAALALMLAQPASALVDVDVELVLAVDVSGSMDRDEQALQRQGYIDAFRHPEVLQAIRLGVTGTIAVTYVEWAGTQHQEVVVPWTIVSDEATADGFARAIGDAPYRSAFGTSISSALRFAVEQFADSSARGIRQVIDVSGDGANNMGLPVLEARDAVVARGIVINGLPVMLDDGVFGRTRFRDLDIYFADCVIGGPGAFIVPVREEAGFGEAIRRKLVLEIAGLPPRLMHASDVQSEPRVDCLIGEKTRGNWYRQDP